MKYCSNCGHEVESNAIYCPICGWCFAGDSIPTNYQPQYYNMDAPSVGYGILCFFFPVVGLVLYLVWKDQYPQRAKSCGIGALVSVILTVLIYVCYFIVAIIAISSGV